MSSAWLGQMCGARCFNLLRGEDGNEPSKLLIECQYLLGQLLGPPPTPEQKAEFLRQLLELVQDESDDGQLCVCAVLHRARVRTRRRAWSSARTTRLWRRAPPGSLHGGAQRGPCASVPYLRYSVLIG